MCFVDLRLSLGRATGHLFGGVVLAVLLVSVMPDIAESQTVSGGEVMEAASARFAHVTSYCADFHQVVEVTLLRDHKESEGRLCQDQPNLFAMIFSDPDGDRIISDGRYFWVYYPSIDSVQVIRADLEQGGAEHDFFRRFLDEPNRKYRSTRTGDEEVAGRTTHRVELDPVSDRGFVSAVVWIDQETNLIRRLQVHEDNGSIRTVTLTGFDEAAAPAADLFTFEPPPGAHVIQR